MREPEDHRRRPERYRTWCGAGGLPGVRPSRIRTREAERAVQSCLARPSGYVRVFTFTRLRVARNKKSKILIVDASNVAHSTEGEKPRLANLFRMRDKIREEGYEPILVADAALRHQIDDAQSYEQLVDSGEIKQAPAGTDADYFILSFARELNASIVSNDRFRDSMKSFPELRRRAVRYMIVRDEVVLEWRTRRRQAG